MGVRRVLVALALASLVAGSVRAADPPAEFRRATEAIQAGNYPEGIELLHGLAAAGDESPALYWNWAQAARARGNVGEAMWALLRARELDPGDAAVGREISDLREAAALDPAEINPEPLVALARLLRRAHVATLAAVLLLASLLLHVAARLRRASRWPVAGGWAAFVAGALLAAVVLVGALAPPTAVVVGADVPLADAASPAASVLATLRQGEVVPVLSVSGPYLKIQDSSGARGWVVTPEVWRLDRPPEDPVPASSPPSE